MVVLVTVYVGVSSVEPVVLIGNSVEVILDSDVENEVDDSMVDVIMVDVKSVVVSVVNSVEPVFSVLIEDADAVVDSTEVESLVPVLLSGVVDGWYVEVDKFSLLVIVDSVGVTSVSVCSDVTDDDVDDIALSSSVVDISVLVRSVVDMSVVVKSIVDESVVTDGSVGESVDVTGIACLFFRLTEELGVVVVSLTLVEIVVSFSLSTESVVIVADSSIFVVIVLSSDDCAYGNVVAY